jgi:hypothetical protein
MLDGDVRPSDALDLPLLEPELLTKLCIPSFLAGTAVEVVLSYLVLHLLPESATTKSQLPDELLAVLIDVGSRCSTYYYSTRLTTLDYGFRH